MEIKSQMEFPGFLGLSGQKNWRIVFRSSRKKEREFVKSILIHNVFRTEDFREIGWKNSKTS